MLYRFLGNEGMNTRFLGFFAVILVMTIILGTFITYIWIDNLIIGGGPDTYWPPPIEYRLSNLGEENWTEYIMNVNQGSTQQVNFTLTSNTDQELTRPLDLKLRSLHSETYNGELDSFIPSNNPTRFHYNQSAQNKLFNYTFSHNQLVLQPYESNSTVITVEIAEGAPLGFYVFSITLGKTEVTQQQSWQLSVVVDPKLEYYKCVSLLSSGESLDKTREDWKKFKLI